MAMSFYFSLRSCFCSVCWLGLITPYSFVIGFRGFSLVVVPSYYHPDGELFLHVFSLL